MKCFQSWRSQCLDISNLQICTACAGPQCIMLFNEGKWPGHKLKWLCNDFIHLCTHVFKAYHCSIAAARLEPPVYASAVCVKTL